MISSQLEFNIDNQSSDDLKILTLQKQIDEMNESMGKVRRKLFSQMGEVQKLCLSLQNENMELKKTLSVLQNEKPEWSYLENNLLFALS